MSSVSTQIPRRDAWGMLAAILVLGLAVIAALKTGSQIGAINGGVESLATASGTWLGQLGGALPFGYAFGAGMVAAVNPCGFALLPAYLALYMKDAEGGVSRGLMPRLGRSLLVSGAMTLAFVLVFGLAGLALSAASAALSRYLPLVGIAVGVVLIVV